MGSEPENQTLSWSLAIPTRQSGRLYLNSRLILESDLIPYSACTVLPAHAALVIAPHPDDEVFGCGGAIASHVKHGQPVCVVVLTDGALYGDAAVRQLESNAAAAVLGYGLPEFWAFPDRGLRYSEALVTRLVDKIATTKSDLVYAPSPWEIHPDHRQAHMLAVEAVRRSAPGVRLAFYEIGAPLRPNLLLDLTALSDTKEAAMRCFGSQLQQQDYVGHIQALNRYRSYTLSHTVQAAEAYWVLTAKALDQTWPDAVQAMVSPGGLAAAALPEDFPPLVSVLIRSVDGRFLPDALDSVALQAYPNIEVIVAHSGAISLPAKCGPFALRGLLCDGSGSAGRTANQLMAQAAGEFLLFLDEDDWLMPEHVAALADVLMKQPHTQAVFTGVRLAQEAGWPTGEVCVFPFDEVLALEATAVPVHAVLFSRQLRDMDCQFDDTLQHNADWKFWTSIAKQTFFVKLAGTSAARRNRAGRAALCDPAPKRSAVASALVHMPIAPDAPATPAPRVSPARTGYLAFLLKTLRLIFKP